ncbi:MAG TPA: (2Fe-2S)-binding protein, partial [Polyangiaceae bacterium]|nr:(2Fe-2S)-binding protein [Polyangiaceae bacterium]
MERRTGETASGTRESRALLAAYDRLAHLNPKWIVEFGPREGGGWVLGTALRQAEEEPFAGLLARIMERMQTRDRKVAAASFALRFGWASAVAIAPYLSDACVPDVALENVSLRFGSGVLFERVALHEPRAYAPSPGHDDALAALREVLMVQASPVVDTLERWSKFPRRALWGQVTSSWGAQFEIVLSGLDRADHALAAARSFFDVEGPAFAAAPTLYTVEHAGATRVFHCRASCCLYYKVKAGSYCASCPLLAEDERIARNRAWIERSLST